MKVAILSKQEAIQADKQLQIHKEKDTDIFVISIVDPQNENPNFLSSKAQLNVKFKDNLTDPKSQHAVDLVDFISKIPKDNSFLVVHCEQGISRSAAVGLFAYVFHYGHAVKPLPSGGGYKAYPAKLGHNTFQSSLFYTILFGVMCGIITIC